ncbi:sensor histidine kinase [Kitasatospora brasiliensis]|uniref:sensor histidine kinase n=1 Tax=Kitasatospora brasiliensis TaxID=3058040 RepID=UPI0029319BEF|nr:ATP-binding protein [Kitasatospora sp. K002]
MLRAGSSPTRRRRAPLLGWLLPTAVMAAAVAVAALVVSDGARAAVLWCGATGTVLVAVVAAESARRGRALSESRDRHARQTEDLQRRLAAQEDELDRLARREMRRVVAGARYGYSFDVLTAPLEESDAPVSPRFRRSLIAVAEGVAQAVDDEVSRRDSAERAFVHITRRVQAIIHRQAKDLREMEDRHGNDPAVFDDLLRLDHGNALTGRLADSIAVLSGARPGRQWNRPIALYSVLRGGMSRILEYQRVELHPVEQISVTGPAVEPLIHAVAELLDNATRYSPPHSQVHLSASEVQSGIAIEIEDGGLGLSDEARFRAERSIREAMVSKDFDDLTESPRLGFAIVGRLCQAYGFQISLRRSAYGGVRAVLVVPKALLTTAPPTGRAHGIGAFSGPRPLPPNRPRPQHPTTTRPWGFRTTMADIEPTHGPSNPWGPPAAVPAPVAGDDEVIVTEWTANGLPQRRRSRPMVPRAGYRGTAQPTGPMAQAPRPAKERKPPGLWVEAFMEGIKGTGPSPSGAADAAQPSAGHTSAAHTSDETAGKGEQ